MENKHFSQMKNEEILRQQLQLLAERSRVALIEELPQLTLAMIEIYKNLPNNKRLNFSKDDAFVKAATNLKQELDIEAIAGKAADELANKIERTVCEISDSDY